MEIVIKTSMSRNIFSKLYYFIFYPIKSYKIIKKEHIIHSITINFLFNFFNLLYIFIISSIFEIIVGLTNVKQSISPFQTAILISTLSSFGLASLILGLCFLLAFLTYSLVYRLRTVSYILILKSFLYSSLIPTIIYVIYRIIQIIVSLIILYISKRNVSHDVVVKIASSIFSWGTILNYIVYSLIIINFLYFLIKSLAYFLEVKEKDIIIATIVPIGLILFIIFILFYHYNFILFNLLHI